MLTFFQFLEARTPKPKTLDKASNYSTYNLARPNGSHPADELLKAFEAGADVPLYAFADSLEEEGHPNSVFFRSPEKMAKAAFYMSLPGATEEMWNSSSSATFRKYQIDRFTKLFNGKYKPNYRSQKGQLTHGQLVSFFHDLIHSDGVPAQARS